jgi:hypothetical protein
MSATRFELIAATLLSLVAAEARGDFPATISPPVALNSNAPSNAGTDLHPAIASDGQGHWVAVWQSDENLNGIGTDTDILVARSTDNGATWTSAAALNTNAVTDERVDTAPKIASDGQGHWIAVWQSLKHVGLAVARDIHMARSTDNGASWTPPVPLNAKAGLDTGANTSPHIATDRHGRWVVVWESENDIDGSGMDGDINVTRSDDNGETWTRPVLLNNNATSDSGVDSEPRIATDDQSHWIAVWQSNEDLNGIGTVSDILAARRSDNGVTWSDPFPLTSNAASDTGQDTDPDVAMDENGIAIVIWASDENLGGATGTEGDIFVARSADHGATWSDPAPLNTDAAGDPRADEFPSITTDGRGHWMATWDGNNTSAGSIGDYDIFIEHSSDNRATWTAPVPLNTNADVDLFDDYFPQLATDGRGNWVGVWHMEPSAADADIFVARFALPDCNNNGVGDRQDIADGASADCDTNGAPDECDGDSDADGVIDACDNCPADANADQADSNGDGIGDACAVAPPDASCGACGPGATALMATAFSMLLMRGQRRRRRNQ